MGSVRRAFALVLTTVAAVATVLLLGAGNAAAAPSEQDKAFLRAAHQANLAEIAAGELAVQRSRTDEIRRHARLIVEEHQRLDAEVGALAKRLAVRLPATASRAQLDEVAQLSRRSGRSFDAAWLAHQIAAHRQSVQAGRRQVSTGSDPQVKALAQRAGPVVQAHLAILQETAGGRRPDAVEGGASGDSNGEPARTAPLGLGLVGLAVVLVAAALFVLARRRRA